jgi:hypothetical protein
VLTEHGVESLGPSATARASHARRRAGLALTLSLALHAVLVAALGWSAHAREPTRAALTFLPLVVIHEEPALAAPPAEPAAPPARARPRPPAAKPAPPAPAPRRLAPLAEPAPRAEPPPLVGAARVAAPAAPAVAAAPPAPAPAGAGLARHALAQPAPRYPRAARLRGAEGTAWLSVDVAP